jgi:hypothetical protein
MLTGGDPDSFFHISSRSTGIYFMRGAPEQYFLLVAGTAPRSKVADKRIVISGSIRNSVKAVDRGLL